MNINVTYAVDYLRKQFVEGEIDRETMETLTDFVLTYSIYLAAVRQLLGRDIELGMNLTETLIELAHESILTKMIIDLQFKKSKINA